MSRLPRSRPIHTLAVAVLVLTWLAGCAADAREAPPPAAAERASSDFWSWWGDGCAEMSGYTLRIPRYGEIRGGEVVLVYVTEDMDRRTWIKDDRGDVPPEFRVPVLKLNQSVRFRTGIYPYSVMTSVFSPVDGRAPERFAPAKLSLSAQEWCGHVYHLVWPEPGRFREELHSYFSAEGDAGRTAEIPAGALYEDALLIQLRELDGAFAGGGDWSGALVPSLWLRRASHQPLRAVDAAITRTVAERDGVPVTRFTLRTPDRTRRFDVERAAPRRILGWESSDGERAEILRTTRLPYWRLNHEGDESHRSELGLAP